MESQRQEIAKIFTNIKPPSSSWHLQQKISLKFRTHHPQGLVRVGDTFFVSSVEVTTPPEKDVPRASGYDRTPGKGTGYLFAFNFNGDLLATAAFGEGTIYHPGGIDYDGEWIWMPVAEYRPASRSIIYRVNPATLSGEEVFRWNDHIGGLAYNRDRQRLYGMSWGSRTFHAWELDAQSKKNAVPPHRMRRNGSFYVDHQDCCFLCDQYMLCSGLKEYDTQYGSFALGGIELVDLELLAAIHQVPVPIYSPSRRPMTQNPFWVDLYKGHLRCYFIPDDNESTLYVYDIKE